MKEQIKKTYKKLLNAHKNEELYHLDAYLKLIPENRKAQLNTSTGVIQVPTFEEADYLLFTSLSGKVLRTAKDDIPIFSINNQHFSIEQLRLLYSEKTNTIYQKPYNCDGFLALIEKLDQLDEPIVLSPENQKKYELYHFLTDNPYLKPTVLIYSFQNYNFRKEQIMHGFSFENNQYIKNPSPLDYNLLFIQDLCEKNKLFWSILSQLQIILRDYPLMEQRQIVTEHLFDFVQQFSKEKQVNQSEINLEIEKQLKKLKSKNSRN